MWISKLAKMFPHLSKILSNSDGFFPELYLLSLTYIFHNSRLSLWTLAWWHYKYIPKDLCPKMYAPLSQTAWHPGLGLYSHSHLLWHRCEAAISGTCIIPCYPHTFVSQSGFYSIWAHENTEGISLGFLSKNFLNLSACSWWCPRS